MNVSSSFDDVISIMNVKFALCTSVLYNGSIQRLHRWRVESKIVKVFQHYPEECEYEKYALSVLWKNL